MGIARNGASRALGRSGDGPRRRGSPFVRLTLRRDLRRSRASIAFVVLGLSKTSYVYAASGNHDPDGDSDGTRITVTRP